MTKYEKYLRDEKRIDRAFYSRTRFTTVERLLSPVMVYSSARGETKGPRFPTRGARGRT